MIPRITEDQFLEMTEHDTIGYLVDLLESSNQVDFSNCARFLELSTISYGLLYAYLLNRGQDDETIVLQRLRDTTLAMLFMAYMMGAESERESRAFLDDVLDQLDNL